VVTRFNDISFSKLLGLRAADLKKNVLRTLCKTSFLKNVQAILKASLLHATEGNHLLDQHEQ